MLNEEKLKQGVSILMPLYNGIEFIQESVQSVLDQTIKDTVNWELLIAINGYSINSDIYRSVLKYTDTLNDNRIRVLDFYQCKGKAQTLNNMMPKCLYNYIAILDVDDIWLPTKLETQLPFILKEYDVIGTKCVYFGDSNSIPNIPSGDISTFNFLIFNPVINSSALIKNKLAYWDETVFGIEDYDLWLRLWRQNYLFYNCDSIQVKHRIHTSSAFNAKGNNNHVAELKQKYAK